MKKIILFCLVLTGVLATANTVSAAVTATASVGTYSDKTRVSFTGGVGGTYPNQGYKLYASRSAGELFNCDASHQIDSSGPSGVATINGYFDVIGNTAGDVIAYKVADLNVWGNVISCSIASYGMKGPPYPPTSVLASDNLTDKVTITFGVSSSRAAGYNIPNVRYGIQRSTSQGGGYADIGFVNTPSNSTVTTMSYDDTTAIAGTTYYYKVWAEKNNIFSTATGPDAGIRVAPASYSLQVNKSGTGSGTITAAYPFAADINCGSDCSQTYTSTGGLSLTATPAAGSTFSSWSGCTVVNGNVCAIQLNTPGIKTVTANFTVTTPPPPPPPGSYVLTVNKSSAAGGTIGGDVSCGTTCANTTKSFTSGSVPYLSATPASGYTFTSWSGCGSGNPANPSGCYVTMNAAKTVTATFAVSSCPVGQIGTPPNCTTPPSTAYTISGSITPAVPGTTMAITGAGFGSDDPSKTFCTVVSGGGSYSCTAGLSVYVFAVTPTVPAGYTISPTSYSINQTLTGNLIKNFTTTAPPLVIATCGPAQGVVSATEPTTGLCSSGTAGNKSSTATNWLWSCTLGASTVNCSAPKPGAATTCNDVDTGSWINATGTPPANNRPAPLNVGPQSQAKTDERGCIGIGLGNDTAGLPVKPKGILDLKGTVFIQGLLGVSAIETDSLSVAGLPVTGGTSDLRLKTSISPLSGMLNKILQLKPVSFQFRDQTKYGFGTKLGLIAQDVEKILPELVSAQTDGYKRVDYSGAIAPLIQAIQEQQAQIDELKKEIAELKAAH